MNAVEKLTAAISRLELLKAESTPGPWFVGDANGSMPMEYRPLWVVSTIESAFRDGEAPDDHHLEIHVGDGSDAELIVTLHRTIDAQLAWLRYAVSLEATVQPPADFRAFALALADAINGEA